MTTTRSKRTEAQALANAPLRIVMGGLEHVVQPLPYGLALDWAERLGDVQKRHEIVEGKGANITDSVSGLREVADLLFDYMQVPIEYRRDLLNKAIKSEIREALQTIITEVFS